MNTDGHGLVCERMTRDIIGCAMEVLNVLGHGLNEKPYENALVIELKLRRILHVQQPRFQVCYKGSEIGLFIPDLIVSDSVVVDTKVVDRITDHELGQMLNYLKITGLRIGMILNFKRAKLEWKRLLR
jgi:GxxExxY protein